MTSSGTPAHAAVPSRVRHAGRARAPGPTVAKPTTKSPTTGTPSITAMDAAAMPPNTTVAADARVVVLPFPRAVVLPQAPPRAQRKADGDQFKRAHAATILPKGGLITSSEKQ
jgi:hypothetical protein